MQTVNVPAHALPYLEGRFEDFAKRAKRIRAAAPALTIHRLFFVWEDAGENSFGEPVKRRVEMAEVSVTGERPMLAGWEPVANLVHANGANVVRTREGFELPETYRTRQVCDHCGHNRRRNDTWVLRHTETGELRQIGRQCLQDFIGSETINPAALACWADAWGAVGGDEDFCGGGGARFFGVAEYLAAVAACIREDRGFTSKKRAGETGGTPTSELAFRVLCASTKEERDALPKVTADDVETANKGLAWCAEWTESGEYPHNVRTAVGMGYVLPKTAGFIASLLGAAWPNAMKKAAERAEKPVTRHFPSDEGKRITTGTMDVVKVRGWQGDYGWTTFIELRAGDVACVWYASGSVDVKEGDRVSLKATIKRHGTDRYTGGAVTTLTRCKILEKVS